MFSFYLTGFKKILNIAKKIFLVLTVYFVVISLFFHFIAKDKPKTTIDPIKKNREEIYKVINDPQLNKTEEGKLAIAFYRLTMCGLIGEACTDNPADADKNFSHSLFGFMTNLLVLPYANPPASGVYWAYSGLQNAGFVPKTYAAEGIGFAAIKPLMNIWKVFRDLAYMLLVLVLIAIGFMIMFRTKINPQTVISVENSLPKIVIALLLITFSFPIAGFLIDIMYILIIVIVSILGQVNPNLTISKLQNEYITASPSLLLDKLLFLETNSDSPLVNIIAKFIGFFTFGSFGENVIKGEYTIVKSVFTMWSLGSSILSFLPSLIRGLLAFLSLPTSLFVASKSGDLFEKFTKPLENLQAATFGIGKFIPGIVWIFVFLLILPLIFIFLLPLIIGFIVFLTLFFLFFRIFFILLTTYLKIIFYILFSPLYLLLEAIPGKNSFSSWLKNLFAEISTFPLIVTIILTGNLIVTNTQLSIYVDPITNQQWAPPFLYAIDPNAWTFLIGYGIVLLIPEIIQLWKSSLGVKESPLKLGLGTFFGSLGVAYGATTGGLGFFGSLTQMPIIGPQITKRIQKTGWGEKLIPPSPDTQYLKAIAKATGVPEEELKRIEEA